MNFITSVIGCWIWCGETNIGSGHGVLFVDGARIGAHRYSRILTDGKPPEPGLVVRHKCDNPPCVNPDHLEWGTRRQNHDDMTSRGRARWQRKKIRGGRFARVIEGAVYLAVAHALGVDRYSMLLWVNGYEPVPYAVAHELNRMLGAPMTFAFWPRGIVGCALPTELGAGI